MIDYFAPAATREEEILRRIKGNYRRYFIACAMEEDGLETIPPQWLEHGLKPLFQDILGAENPSYRGGEDLPDLADGEVEIARLTYANAVHGEVTSLRARPAPEGPGILLGIVDEYETAIALARDRIEAPLTAEEILDLFRTADPKPTESACELLYQSWFYDDLDELADARTAAGHGG